MRTILAAETIDVRSPEVICYRDNIVGIARVSPII